MSGKVSLKAFASRHDGKTVETIQVNANTNQAWEPGPRVLKYHATYMTLDESRRDYAGMRYISASDNTATYLDVDMNTIVTYIVVN